MSFFDFSPRQFPQFLSHSALFSHSTILLVRHSYHNRIARLPSVFRLVGGKRNRHVAYRSKRIPRGESVYPNFACRPEGNIPNVYVKTSNHGSMMSSRLFGTFLKSSPLVRSLALSNNFSCQNVFLVISIS